MPLSFPQTGSTHICTFYVQEREPLLRDQRRAYWLSHLLYDLQAEGNFDLLGWVILPDHIHMLIHTESISALHMHNLFVKKSSFFLNRDAGKKHTLFWGPDVIQKKVRSPREVSKALYEIFFDPVYHHIVDDPIDYPFSSCHDFLHHHGISAYEHLSRLSKYEKENSLIHEKAT